MGAAGILIVAAALLGHVSSPPVAHSRCDRLEKNTFYDGRTGKVVLVQYIGWNWHENLRGYHVAWWKSFRDRKPVVSLSPRGRHVMQWEDGTLWQRVEADSYVETETPWDREVWDRQEFDTSERAELPMPKQISGKQGVLHAMPFR